LALLPLRPMPNATQRNSHNVTCRPDYLSEVAGRPAIPGGPSSWNKKTTLGNLACIWQTFITAEVKARHIVTNASNSQLGENAGAKILVRTQAASQTPEFHCVGTHRAAGGPRSIFASPA